MTLAGAQGSSATALRHALYLWGMQPNEGERWSTIVIISVTNDLISVNLAYFDMMTHLGVNLPSHPNAVYRRMGVYGGGHGSPGGSPYGSGGHGSSGGSPYGGGSGSPYGGVGGSPNGDSPIATLPQSLLHNASSHNDITFLNNVYVQRDYPINYHYHLTLQRFYKVSDTGHGRVSLIVIHNRKNTILTSYDFFYHHRQLFILSIFITISRKLDHI